MGFFRGKRVLVYGMGLSGQAVCRLLHSQDACVSMYDDSDKFSNLFCYEKEPLKNSYDFIVVSPGIKVIGNEIISHFRSLNVPVISELDLAFSLSQGKTIAITGTNGKTTVTSLLGEIFKNAGKETFVCGNIGLPISSIAMQTTKKSFLVCEVSNFQLELSKVFNPDYACILNLQEDHIDRHGSFSEYVRVKNLISQNFGKNNFLVVNLDDNNVNLIEKRGKIITSTKSEGKRGAYIRKDIIYFNKTPIMPVDEVGLIGSKNLENVLCAISVAMVAGIKSKVIRSTIVEFKPPMHRLEFVGIINGVEYYNDSKSTNVACVEMAIESLNKKKLILLLGGQNKNCDFSSLFRRKFNIKKVICFGEAGRDIAKVSELYGYDTVIHEHMSEGVKFAKKYAKNGDCVLFSPGCASFDEFGSYAIRGQRFKEMVNGEE